VISLSINSIPVECSILLVSLLRFLFGFDSGSESDDEFDDEEVEDFLFLFDFFLVSFFDLDCFTAFFGDLERGFEIERDLRSCLISRLISCLIIRFWAGEACFEDFEGFDSLDFDLPLRTDSDFLCSSRHSV